MAGSGVEYSGFAGWQCKAGHRQLKGSWFDERDAVKLEPPSCWREKHFLRARATEVLEGCNVQVTQNCCDIVKV